MNNIQSRGGIGNAHQAHGANGNAQQATSTQTVGGALEDKGCIQGADGAQAATAQGNTDCTQTIYTQVAVAQAGGTQNSLTA